MGAGLGQRVTEAQPVYSPLSYCKDSGFYSVLDGKRLEGFVLLHREQKVAGGGEEAII